MSFKFLNIISIYFFFSIFIATCGLSSSSTKFRDAENAFQKNEN